MANADIIIADEKLLPQAVELYNATFRPKRELDYFKRRFMGRYNPLTLIARMEDKPVGFWVGFELKPGMFYHWLGAVATDVRRHGVGRQLQEAQQAWAKDHGYEYIRCECMNHQREFIHFAIALGYDIVGIRWDSTHADNLVVFEKNLIEQRRMPFEVAISEVGPDEFPLMEVLRDTVFTEFGFISRAPIAKVLADARDPLFLLAHLEGNPVGFSAGQRRTTKGYYVNFMAILRDYRRQGIGRQLLERQEMFAKAVGYEQIEFNTQNRFRGMMTLGLARGYRPVGMEQHDGTLNDLTIRFGKSLVRENPVDDVLLAAIEHGSEITGMMRQDDGRLKTLLKS